MMKTAVLALILGLACTVVAQKKGPPGGVNEAPSDAEDTTKTVQEKQQSALPLGRGLIDLGNGTGSQLDFLIYFFGTYLLVGLGIIIAEKCFKIDYPKPEKMDPADHESQSKQDKMFKELVLPTFPLRRHLQYQVDRKIFINQILESAIFLFFMQNAFGVQDGFKSYKVYQGAFYLCNSADTSIAAPPKATGPNKARLLLSGGPASFGTTSDACPDFGELSNSVQVNAWFDTVPDALLLWVYTVCPVCEADFERSAVNISTDHNRSDTQSLGKFAITRAGERFVTHFSCTAKVPGYSMQVSCAEEYESKSNDNLFVACACILAAFWLFRSLQRVEEICRHLALRARAKKRKQTVTPFAEDVIAHMTLWNFVKFVALVIPPGAFVLLKVAPDESQAFQNLFGISCLLNCMQFYSYAEFWAPFQLLVKTLNKASGTLANFMIAMLVTFVFFAFAGHIMFGSFFSGYATISNALVAVFDHLLNPFSFDGTMREHNATGVYIYYFFINIFFIMIISQFLVAVLCDSFGKVREEMTEDAKQDNMPTGFVLVRPFLETFQPGMVRNQFRWYHETFGFRTSVLTELLTFFVERGDEAITIQEFVEMLEEMGQYTVSMDDSIKHMYFNFGALDIQYQSTDSIMAKYTVSMDDSIKHSALQSDLVMMESGKKGERPDNNIASGKKGERPDASPSNPSLVEPALVDAILILQKKVAALASQFDSLEGSGQAAY